MSFASTRRLHGYLKLPDGRALSRDSLRLQAQTAPRPCLLPSKWPPASGRAGREGRRWRKISFSHAVADRMRAEQDHNRAALFTSDIDRQSPMGTIPIAPEHLAAASFNPASMRSRRRPRSLPRVLRDLTEPSRLLRFVASSSRPHALSLHRKRCNLSQELTRATGHQSCRRSVVSTAALMRSAASGRGPIRPFRPNRAEIRGRISDEV